MQPDDPVRRALQDLVDAVIDVHAYGDIEGGCEGNGPLVRALRALGQEIPPSLKEWLGGDDVPLCIPDGPRTEFYPDPEDPEYDIETGLTRNDHLDEMERRRDGEPA